MWRGLLRRASTGHSWCWPAFISPTASPPKSLGVINLIQASDPGLRGDIQLATMRAAADYMLGRYRDAHNDLAGPSFDADRHAALWRGLTEAALENWGQAHTYLEQAAPVLKKYQPEWQARARLADAEATLGMNRLELADAALDAGAA